MAWEITRAGECGDPSRVGLYFPHTYAPLKSDKKEHFKPTNMEYYWYTLDDDGDLVYSGVMDFNSFNLHLEDILDFSMNDCGATSLWVREPESQDFECAIG